MGRLPYDSSCSLVYGPAGANPGQVYATGPCRFVYEKQQIPLLAPLSSRIAYVTLDFAKPNQAHVSISGTKFITNYAYADLIQVGPLNFAAYLVLFVEAVNYRSHGPYYRAHIDQFPFCSACPISPGAWSITLGNDYTNFNCPDCANLNGQTFVLYWQGDCLWVSDVFAGPCGTPSQWYLERNFIGNTNLTLQAVSSGIFLAMDPILPANWKCNAPNKFVNPSWEGTPACHSASSITAVPL